MDSAQANAKGHCSRQAFLLPATNCVRAHEQLDEDGVENTNDRTRTFDAPFLGGDEAAHAGGEEHLRVLSSCVVRYVSVTAFLLCCSFEADNHSSRSVDCRHWSVQRRNQAGHPGTSEKSGAGSLPSSRDESRFLSKMTCAYSLSSSLSGAGQLRVRADRKGSSP